MSGLATALVYALPALIGSVTAFVASIHAAKRAIRIDSAAILQQSREAALKADSERIATREKLLDLERDFDRLRSALRGLIDAVHERLDRDHPAVVEAKAALDENLL